MSVEIILAKIAAITDGGKNTAFEMRSILNNITTEFSGSTNIPTNTSNLINDGEDGINPYITELQLSGVTSNTTQDVTASIEVGAIGLNDVIPSGTSLTEFIQTLISPLVLPTIQNNRSLNLLGISTQTLEIGTPFIQQTSFTFNRGLIDNKNASPNIPLVGIGTTELYSGADIDSNGLIDTNIVAGANNWSLQLTYEAGTGDYFDSDGNIATNLDAQRVAGTISDSTPTITGRYRYWYDVGAIGSTPTTSAGVRGLSDTGFVQPITFDISIPIGDREVTFFIPDTFTLVSALFVESSNADVTNTFLPSSIFVDNNGFPADAVPYTKFTATIGGIGYPSVATYRITII